MAGLQSKRVVALFSASTEAVDLLRWMQDVSDVNEYIWCRFADVKKGRVNVAEYLTAHNPQVLLFDIALPYLENWRFAKGLCAAPAMRGRREMFITTNKAQLDAALGKDSHAIDVAGTPAVIHQVVTALEDALAPFIANLKRGSHTIH